MSSSQWEDETRIKRRLEEIKFICEFNGCDSPVRKLMIPFPSNTTRIFNREHVKTYFDFGCGDGDITVAIGRYLGLDRENTLGGDVIRNSNENMTFVQLIESDCKIAIGECMIILLD